MACEVHLIESTETQLASERGKCGGQLVGLERRALALDRAGCEAVFAKILVTLQCSAS